MSNLERLLSIMERKGYSSCFTLRHQDDPVRKALELRRRLIREIKTGEHKILAVYEQAFNDPEIREILRISLPSAEDPKIVDLTDALEITGDGRVYGLKLTEVSPASFKGSVVAGSILMDLITGDGNKPDTFVGCGIINSAIASKYYAKRLGLKAKYWLPSNLPSHLVDALRSEMFEVFHEDEEDLAVGNDTCADYTNACYATLAKKLQTDPELRQNCLYFAHSELASVLMYPVAKAYREAIQNTGISTNVLISPVGAGTFFSPFVLAGFADENYLVETTENHPMTDKHEIHYREIRGMGEIVIGPIDRYAFGHHKNARRVVARRFGENPFIVDSFWDNIDGSYLIGASADYEILDMLQKHNVRSGMTSAVPLVAARDIAQSENKTVFVPLFERTLRDYGSDNIPAVDRIIDAVKPVLPYVAAACFAALGVLTMFGMMDPRAQSFPGYGQ